MTNETNDKNLSVPTSDYNDAQPSEPVKTLGSIGFRQKFVSIFILRFFSLALDFLLVSIHERIQTDGPNVLPVDPPLGSLFSAPVWKSGGRGHPPDSKRRKSHRRRDSDRSKSGPSLALSSFIISRWLMASLDFFSDVDVEMSERGKTRSCFQETTRAFELEARLKVALFMHHLLFSHSRWFQVTDADAIELPFVEVAEVVEAHRGEMRVELDLVKAGDTFRCETGNGSHGGAGTQVQEREHHLGRG
jgi:hypothetical protein